MYVIPVCIYIHFVSTYVVLLTTKYTTITNLKRMFSLAENLEIYMPHATYLHYKRFSSLDFEIKLLANENLQPNIYFLSIYQRFVICSTDYLTHNIRINKNIPTAK